MAHQNSINARIVEKYTLGGVPLPNENIIQTTSSDYSNGVHSTQSQNPIYSKQDIYKCLLDELMTKVQETQRENERCVFRIHVIRKMIRRRVRDVALLKKRLDRYNDSWRTAPIISPHPKRKIQQKRGPKPKPTNITPNVNTAVKEKKITKPRTKKLLTTNNNKKTDINTISMSSCMPPPVVSHKSKADIYNCGLEEGLHASAEVRLHNGQPLQVV